MKNEAESWEQYPILSTINSPDDVKRLSSAELSKLTAEIRSYLVKRVTENGGHLASNLGVVELTLALHRVFSTPKDHIIFDVGHQSYVHKLLTGRRNEFQTLRQGGGISGFPKRSESEHDCFGTGHSSTSLSAALGFAEADSIKGSDAYTVCVFGDGAYTGGMIHEALNNARKDLRLILILNENEMSISKNIGRFAKNLSRIRASKGYFKTKTATYRFLRHIPFIGKWLVGRLVRLKMGIKAALYGSNYFENLGLYYIGPADGNDEAAVERLLKVAKESNQSCVIHLKTVKGKGYAPAEETPDLFHGLAPKNCTKNGETFSECFGKVLSSLADTDERICAVTAAMTSGTGLSPFRDTHKNRFFDVGIAEEHAVTFAAGLAADGMRPYVAVYSTFLQRAYDNIIHDVALQGLPVVFCIDRAGLNPADGATHHGIYDVAFLSEVPGMQIYTPVTKDALCRILNDSLQAAGPVAIRYPSGCENEKVKKTFYEENSAFEKEVRTNYSALEMQTAEELDALIVTDGKIVTEALKAVETLGKTGKKVGVLLLEKICPYAEVATDVLQWIPQKAIPILFLEEEIRNGGMGMMLCDKLKQDEKMQNKKTVILGLDNSCGVQTKNEPIYASFSLDADSIEKQLEQKWKETETKS